MVSTLKNNNNNNNLGFNLNLEIFPNYKGIM